VQQNTRLRRIRHAQRVICLLQTLLQALPLIRRQGGNRLGQMMRFYEKHGEILIATVIAASVTRQLCSVALANGLPKRFHPRYQLSIRFIRCRHRLIFCSHAFASLAIPSPCFRGATFFHAQKTSGLHDDF
jgi:hypothetical protein